MSGHKRERASEDGIGRSTTYEGHEVAVYLSQPGARNRPAYQDALDKMLGEVVAQNRGGLAAEPGAAAVIVEHQGQGGENLVSADQHTRMAAHALGMRVAYWDVCGRWPRAASHRVVVVHDAPCTRKQVAQGYCGGCVCTAPEVRLIVAQPPEAAP